MDVFPREANVRMAVLTRRAFYQSWLAVLAVVLPILLPGACTVEPARPPGLPVRIGAIYPLSGPDRATGEEIRAGIELGLEIINREYPLPIPLARESGLPGHGGVKLDVIFRDSKGDPAVAARAAEELVTRDNVVALLGCYHSGATALASEQAEMLRVPFLNAESSAPLLIQRGLRWFFRTTPDEDMFTRDVFRFLREIRERQGISAPFPLVLVFENGLWGTNVAMTQRKLAAISGFRIVAEVPYHADSMDIATTVERVEAAIPAVILQASYDKDATMLVKAYGSAGLRPLGIVGMNAGFISHDFTRSLGNLAENILSREVWSPDLSRKKPIVGVVNELFRKRVHRDMSGNAARAFTGLMVLAEAINRSSHINREEVRNALLATDLPEDQTVMPWDGIRFDPETGQNVLGRGIIVQVRNGRYVTVWPETLAACRPVWPRASERGEPACPEP